MRDERLQIQDSTLVLKKNHYGKASGILHGEREVILVKIGRFTLGVKMG